VEPVRDDSPAAPPPYVWQPPLPKFRDRVWVHAILFAATIAATTFVGGAHYVGYLSDFSNRIPAQSIGEFIAHGFWYSGTIIAILGCHELGHYLTCRYYDVDASLPFFLPAPILSGTLGAFIRIREPIPTKRMLFDIGIAGPIAGFLVAVPTLIFGISMSHMVRIPPDFAGLELGEPLLFKLSSWLFWGPEPQGFSLNLHPMAFAAWWGLLATALNLFPIGQLDGGHISYAVFGPRSTYLTFLMVGVAIALSAFYSSSWIVWTVLTIAMLYMFGPRHPRVFDEDVPLDRARLILAGCALLMFVLCFTPSPIRTMDLIGK